MATAPAQDRVPDSVLATTGTTTQEEPMARTTARTMRRTMIAVLAATLIACSVLLQRSEFITAALLVSLFGIGWDLRRTRELALVRVKP